MYCFKWAVKKFPTIFSTNMLLNRQKESLLIVSPNNIEYKGKLKILDKTFNFVLKKCSRLWGHDLSFLLTNFEIIFIRGENVLTFLSVYNK